MIALLVRFYHFNNPYHVIDDSGWWWKKWRWWWNWWRWWCDGGDDDDDDDDDGGDSDDDGDDFDDDGGDDGGDDDDIKAKVGGMAGMGVCCARDIAYSTFTAHQIFSLEISHGDDGDVVAQ